MLLVYVTFHCEKPKAVKLSTLGATTKKIITTSSPQCITFFTKVKLDYHGKNKKVTRLLNKVP